MKISPKSEEASLRPSRHPSPAFLLAQVGAHAAAQFARRLRKLNLAPHHAGILRILNSNSGMAQQALAVTLGIVASRLVILIDEMEEKGLLERRETPDDRRRYALHLTAKGRSTLEQVGHLAREHSRALLDALNDEEQQQLGLLLQRVADQQGLTPMVHPGYRRMGRDDQRED